MALPLVKCCRYEPTTPGVASDLSSGGWIAGVADGGEMEQRKQSCCRGFCARSGCRSRRGRVGSVACFKFGERRTGITDRLGYRAWGQPCYHGGRSNGAQVAESVEGGPHWRCRCV
jgi:hypothetical protein